MEWGLVAPEQRRVIKNFQESNYLQALEGDIDTAHVSYLHSTKKPQPQNQGVVRPVGRIDKAPKLMVLNHDAGLRVWRAAHRARQRRLLLARHAVPVAACARWMSSRPTVGLGPVLERYRDKVSVAG